MGQVIYSIDELPPLTQKQRDDLKQLTKRCDESIDLSDIPEITDWSGAVRGGLALQDHLLQPKEDQSFLPSVLIVAIELMSK